MISMPFIDDQPSRPKRKARRYSTTWNRAQMFFGSPTLVRKPPLTVQPLATRTVPPAATTVGSRRKGSVTLARLSRCRIESASTPHTSG